MRSPTAMSCRAKNATRLGLSALMQTLMQTLAQTLATTISLCSTAAHLFVAHSSADDLHADRKTYGRNSVAKTT